MAKVTPVDAPPRTPSRIDSIDLLRGLDVWLMLFVNEMAGVAGTPAFLRHYPRNGDGMTTTDIVFPAFLFIVGLAIPFALGGRRARGEPARALWRHVLVRTASLLVIGVLMVNAEEMSAGAPLSPPVWTILTTLAVWMVWMARDERRPHGRWVRAAGVALLIVLVLLYRRDDASGLVQLRTSWWGILGLIGWAYFAAAAVYLLAGDRPGLLTGAVASFYCLYLADEAGKVAVLEAIGPYFDVGRVIASHSAVALSGVLLAVMVVRARAERRDGRRLVVEALAYAGALALVAYLLHSLRDLHYAFWIDKIKATAPWCLYSSAWTAAAWAVLYYFVDVRGFRRWPGDVKAAGENALVAYMMPPVLLSVFTLIGGAFGVNPYAALGANTALGAVRSLVFAWIVVRLCASMRSRGIRIQL